VRADDLNRLSANNGIMANEVVILLAKRAGGDIDSPYFAKLLAAITAALAWLDERTSVDATRFDYRDIALVCMWQHLEHYGLLAGLDRFRRVAARVEHLSTRPSVLATTPEASLADAKAAGWVPG
jgi:glutathione S-transferase